MQAHPAAGHHQGQLEEVQFREAVHQRRHPLQEHQDLHLSRAAGFVRTEYEGGGDKSTPKSTVQEQAKDIHMELGHMERRWAIAPQYIEHFRFFSIYFQGVHPNNSARLPNHDMEGHGAELQVIAHPYTPMFNVKSCPTVMDCLGNILSASFRTSHSLERRAGTHWTKGKNTQLPWTNEFTGAGSCQPKYYNF